MDDVFEIYKQWFRESGIKHNIDDDGDLHFKYQTCNFYILNPKNDTNFLHVILPNIWPIESEEERDNALKVANKLNMTRKALKVLITPSNTILTVEMFIDNTPDVEDFMERILDILISGRSLFFQKMHELQ